MIFFISFFPFSLLEVAECFFQFLNKRLLLSRHLSDNFLFPMFNAELKNIFYFYFDCLLKK